MNLPTLSDTHHTPTSNAEQGFLDPSFDWSQFDFSQNPFASNLWQDTFVPSDLDMFAPNTDQDISPIPASSDAPPFFSFGWTDEQMAQMAQMPLFPLDGNNFMF